MSEQQQQDQKSNFKEARAKYMGLAEEPKYGNNDKGQWCKAKLSFMLEGRDKENKFLMWTPIKNDKTQYKSFEELKQFEWYHIVWVENERDYNGMNWIEKKIVIIKDSKRDDNIQNQQTNEELETELSNPAPIIPTKGEVEQILPAYKDKAGDKDSLNHFIGTVLVNLRKEHVQHIIDSYYNYGR